MARLVFEVGKQNEFLNKVQKDLNLDVKGVANVLGLSARSYRDWLREKTLGRKDSLNLLSKLSGVRMPRVVDEREEFWSGRVKGRFGGLRTYELYGPPGSILSRVIGGRVSQEKRRKNPEFYRSIGCNVAKESVVPKYSEQLAEIVGVILGDGGITNNQLKISLNSEADSGYDIFYKICFLSYLNYKLVSLREKMQKQLTCLCRELTL